MATKKEKAENKEELRKTIQPADIVTDDDSDMPQPQTKSYRQYLKCTDKFFELLRETVGKLPYNTTLRNNNNQQIALSDLMNYLTSNRDHVEVNEMNKAIDYISYLEYNLVAPLMNIIKAKDQQSQLWSLYEG